MSAAILAAVRAMFAAEDAFFAPLRRNEPTRTEDWQARDAAETEAMRVVLAADDAPAVAVEWALAECAQLRVAVVSHDLDVWRDGCGRPLPGTISAAVRRRYDARYALRVWADSFILSPAARSLLDERAEWGIPTSTDAAIVRELAAAGLISIDEIDSTANGRDTVYGYTDAGRAYLRAMEAA